MVFGTAKWAEVHELRQAELLRPFQSKEPHQGLFLGFWREPYYSPDFEPIRYQGDLHQLIVAGTGGGKFTSALAPMLLGSGIEDQAVIAIDPKGEMARLVGPFFQEPFAKKPNVFLLDPWDQCGTGETSSLNVLDQIRADNPNYVDDARALADALIIPSGGQNTHWDNTAVNFLASIILLVALDPKEKQRDLLRVRELVCLTWQLPKGFPGPPRQTLSSIVMQNIESKLGGGAVGRGFAGILNREDKERSGIISSIERDTAWLDSPQMAKVVGAGDIDLKEAALGRNKYFVVIRPDYFNTHRGWLRLTVTAFANAMKRYMHPEDRRRPTRWRHIIIDEFANLGEMKFMLQDVAVGRGFGIKYHLAVQGLSQLNLHYGDDWQSFINNTFQRFFAVGDLFTADYVSKILGAASVKNYTHTQGDTQSVGRGTSDGLNVGQTSGFASGQTSSTRGQTSGNSSSENFGWSESFSNTQVQRPLLTPDEIRRDFAQINQVMCFRGLYPIRSWRPNYWEAFRSLPDFSLKEVLDTVGRKPKTAAELERFVDWRTKPFLIEPHKPEPIPSRVVEEAPLAIEHVAPTAVQRSPWPAVALLIALALACYWFSGPPPQTVRPTRPQTPAALVDIPPPPRQALPPPVPVRTRPAVPDLAAIGDMPASMETVGYLLRLARENMHRCAAGHGAEERKLIDYLLHWAATKLFYVRGQSRGPQLQEYLGQFRQWLLKPGWSRPEREAVFDLLLRATREGYGKVAGAAASLDRLYANGNCPFGTVLEADYLAPVYSRGVTAQR